MSLLCTFPTICCVFRQFLLFCKLVEIDLQPYINLLYIQCRLHQTSYKIFSTKVVKKYELHKNEEFVPWDYAFKIFWEVFLYISSSPYAFDYGGSWVINANINFAIKSLSSWYSVIKHRIRSSEEPLPQPFSKPLASFSKQTTWTLHRAQINKPMNFFSG